MTVLLQRIDLDGDASSLRQAQDSASLAEARSAQRDIIKKLDKIARGPMYQASYKAVIRLQLFFTGRTHELILEFGDKAQALILKRAGKDQVLDGMSGYIEQTEMLKMWGDVFSQWQEDLQAVRGEAASIPFGVLAVMHERLVIPVVASSSL